MAKIEALQTYKNLGMEAGYTYDTEFTEAVKTYLVQYHMADWADSPRPKGLNEYEEKVYSEQMIVVRNSCTYKSKGTTSPFWVRNEWKLIAGIELHDMEAEYNAGVQVYKDGAIYTCVVDTVGWYLADWEVLA